MNLSPIRVFVGYDEREAAGFHVFVQSLIEHSKRERPLAIYPLSGEMRDGTNAFVYARFLVPSLCEFKGSAIFIDGSDMLLFRGIEELHALGDAYSAVQVVKRPDYETKHPQKYVGTSMQSENQNYPRKNWSSVMLWNCEHPANRVLTEEFVAQKSGAYLHRFGWLEDAALGTLPAEWNRLVGEEEIDERTLTSLAHYTLGIPAMPHYARCVYSKEWWATHDRSRRAG